MPAGRGKPGHVLKFERLWVRAPLPDFSSRGEERSLTKARLQKQGVATMKAVPAF